MTPVDLILKHLDSKKLPVYLHERLCLEEKEYNDWVGESRKFKDLEFTQASYHFQDASGHSPDVLRIITFAYLLQATTGADYDWTQLCDNRPYFFQNPEAIAENFSRADLKVIRIALRDLYEKNVFPESESTEFAREIKKSLDAITCAAMDPRCIEAFDGLLTYMSTTGPTLYVHNENYWMEHRFYNHWLDDCAEFKDIDFGSAYSFLCDWSFYDFRDCRIIAFATFCAELQAPNSGVPLFCDFRDGDLLNPEIFSIQDQEIMRSVLKVLIKVESQNPLPEDSPLQYYKRLSRSLYRKIARRKAAQSNQQQ